MNVVVTERYNTVVNSEEVLGTKEYLMQYTRCRIKRYRYNRVLLYFLRCCQDVPVFDFSTYSKCGH
jgi:hypothetical protein